LSFSIFLSFCLEEAGRHSVAAALRGRVLVEDGGALKGAALHRHRRVAALGAPHHAVRAGAQRRRARAPPLARPLLLHTLLLQLLHLARRKLSPRRVRTIPPLSFFFFFFSFLYRSRLSKLHPIIEIILIILFIHPSENKTENTSKKKQKTIHQLSTEK
jgi:hypothetical protein